MTNELKLGIGILVIASALAVTVSLYRYAHADISNPHPTPPSNSVTTAMLVDGAVTNAKLSGSLSLDATKINPGATNGLVLFANSSQIATSTNLSYLSAGNKLYIFGGTIAATTTNFNGQTLTFPANTGSSGQFLQTNGAGSLSWATQTTGTSNAIPVRLNQSVLKGDVLTVSNNSIVLENKQDTTSASMSASNVQNMTTSSASTTVICGFGNSNNPRTFTATMNGANMTQAASSSESFSQSDIWYANATSTGNLSISASGWAAATPGNMTCVAYLGTLAPNTFDASTTNKAAGATTISSTATSNTDYDLAVGECGSGSMNITINSNLTTISAAGNRMAFGESTGVSNVHPTGTFTETCTAGSSNLSQSLVLFKSALTLGAIRASAASTTPAIFSGIAGAAGATSTVLNNMIIDGDASVESGLTAGTRYFLSNSPGQLSSSAGTISQKVGLAASSTDLIITNIY